MTLGLEAKQKHPNGHAILFPELTLLPIKPVSDILITPYYLYVAWIITMAQIKSELLLELASGKHWQNQILFQILSFLLLQ